MQLLSCVLVWLSIAAMNLLVKICLNWMICPYRSLRLQCVFCSILLSFFSTSAASWNKFESLTFSCIQTYKHIDRRIHVHIPQKFGTLRSIILPLCVFALGSCWISFRCFWYALCAKYFCFTSISNTRAVKIYLNCCNYIRNHSKTVS